jgi:outer membrane receptor protein involved in Fe transport
LTGANLAARNTAIANGTFRFPLARNLTDVGERLEVTRRETYRAVAGVRGTFNGDWNYELSGNYGEFRERQDLQGLVNRQRFLLSLDAGRNPVTGQIQCRSQFDPTAATGLVNTSNPLTNSTNAANLAADIAACVPYNAFGQSDNSAAANYFEIDLQNSAKLTQLNFMGFVNGDTSQLFELPGGPVRFALGAEYRRDKAFNNSDPANETGISNFVFLGDVDAKPSIVKEVFGEIQIPLLKEAPFFHELTISAAGRASDYNNAAGTVFAYNAGVEWAPVRDLRLRGNYGRAVRAPNVGETSFPAVPNFANGFIDPCSINAIGASATRTANCQAALTPAQLANLQPSGFSLGVISGSNANLTEETADSYTLGAVITPRFLPGFSLSADYYDITVKDVIVSLAAQTIVNACFDSPNLSTPLCNAFQRNLTANVGPGNELPGQILVNSTVQGPQNFASRKRRGLDIEAAYRRSFGADTRISTRVIYSHGFQNSNFQDPTNPKFENRILSELGDPQDEARFNFDLTHGAVTLGYEMRYLGKMVTSTYENFFPLDSACSTATPPVCPPLNADAIDPRFYPAVFYHDLRLDFAVRGGERGRDLNFYVGVDNILDRKPPLGTTATNANSGIYNIRGRNFFAGFRAKF